MAMTRFDQRRASRLRPASSQMTSSRSSPTRGDGEFRFELFTEKEVRWLEFQAWLVDMGYYQSDLAPEND